MESVRGSQSSNGANSSFFAYFFWLNKWQTLLGKTDHFWSASSFFFLNSIYNFLVQRISSMALLWLLNIFRFDSVIRHILKPCLKIFFFMFICTNICLVIKLIDTYHCLCFKSSLIDLSWVAAVNELCPSISRLGRLSHDP